MKNYLLVLSIAVMLSACSESEFQVEKIKDNCRVTDTKMVISKGVGRVSINTSCGSFTSGQLTELEAHDLMASIVTGRTYDLFVAGKLLYKIRELPTVAL